MVDNQLAESIKHKEVLLDGYIFLKYGSWGDPGYRLVYLTPDLKTLAWKHTDEEKPSGSIPANSLTDIRHGRHTPNFKKKPASGPDQEKLSFTLMGTKRNLDLEASSKEQMDLFVEGIQSLIDYSKKVDAKKP